MMQEGQEGYDNFALSQGTCSDHTFTPIELLGNKP